MNADPIARVYRWLEYAAFGNLLQRCRLEFLGVCGQCRRALVLGDGDGRFTAVLVERYPALAVIAVEGSEAMLALARKRVSGNVQFTRADIRDMPLEGSYDLITTHFVLDCLTNAEVQDLAVRLSKNASPGALWIISEFHIPDSGIRRLRAQLWIAVMYKFFRLATGLAVQQIPNYPAALASAGFHLEEAREHSWGMLRCTLWRFTGDRNSTSH